MTCPGVHVSTLKQKTHTEQTGASDICVTYDTERLDQWRHRYIEELQIHYSMLLQRHNHSTLDISLSRQPEKGRRSIPGRNGLSCECNALISIRECTRIGKTETVCVAIGLVSVLGLARQQQKDATRHYGR
jgi:hypothetical protein